MALLRMFRKLFSLETLDLRFTTSSKAPLPDPSKQETRGKQDLEFAKSFPPLWQTLEFYFYYLVIIVCIPLMFHAVYEVSLPSHPNYGKFEHLLSPGWIGGRKVDNSDTQYSFFRDNIPHMLLVMLIHLSLRRIYLNFTGSHNTAKVSSPAAVTDAWFEQRLKFDFYFALLFLAVLHGFSSLKVLLILSINFSIAKNARPKLIVPLTWIFNISVLFANELCRGYPYHMIAKFISPLQDGDSDRNWGSWLDDRGGIVSRWEVLFKITILRLISFNMDYYWSLGGSTSNSLEKKQLEPFNLSERDRIDISPTPRGYSFRNYVAFTLYTPLYLAGPIVTFNDFLSQARHTPRSITTSRITRYGVRFLLCLLCMEIMLHYLYPVAISKSQPAWEVYTPFQVSMLGYFNLHHIWLKLLLPWRFFRLWALIDGIDAPENMVRCMSNNPSTTAFWRGWHRSFNRWLLRYIYIPLGGSSSQSASKVVTRARTAFNYVAVFTFVAIWHDINLRLLIWGWLIVLFILPEVLGNICFPQRIWQDRQPAYRILCCIGAVGNILMMMTANLIGFALGIDGIVGLISGIVGDFLGIVYAVAACGALYVGAQVMFEIRREERRNGIKINC